MSSSVTYPHIPDSAKVIFAQATPSGRSGVAVVRLSGNHIDACCKALGFAPPAARMAVVRNVLDPQSKSLIDQALVIRFAAPASFTGEDVLEIHTHGSAAVLHTLFQALTTLPFCRPAEPGEFTRRAFMHGKMDLAQIEGLADVIDAQSSLQLAQAHEQMQGSLSHFYEALRVDIVRSLALIEAWIDFPDEEIPEETMQEVHSSVEAIKGRIQDVLASPAGEKIREGFTVAIAGAPNVGKSSLINAIAQRDVAIVTDIAGTTRDAIEVHTDLNGLAVTWIDTAGLREAEDTVERIGIEKSKQVAEKADMILLMDSIVTDSKQCNETNDLSGKYILRVYNKLDIQEGDNAPKEGVAISAKTGENIPLLLDKVYDYLSQSLPACGSVFITRTRHRQCLHEAVEALNAFAEQAETELMAEELRIAAVAVGKITGKVEVDQLLDVIFSEFCIGK